MEMNKKLCEKVTKTALSLGRQTTNHLCSYWFGQPKEPVEMKQFKKHQ